MGKEFTVQVQWGGSRKEEKGSYEVIDERNTGKKYDEQ